MFYWYLLFALAGFLLGSVLFSYHIPKILKDVDIVSASEDGNPGTANAVKYAGWNVGLLCCLLDVLKGFLPVYIAMRLLDQEKILMALVIASPSLGHAIAPFYRFGGGKSIAVSFGIMLGLIPFNWSVLLLAFLYIFFSLVLVIHPNERRSVITFFVFAICVAFASIFIKNYSIALGLIAVATIAMYRNYSKQYKTESEKTTNDEDNGLETVTY